MDSNDPRRRQSNPAGYASQQGLLQQTSPQYPPTSVPDRFRQSHLGVNSPTAAPPAGRGGAIPGYNYPYGEGPQFAGASINPAPMQYQAEYGQEQRPPQQSYQQYGPNVMYNVPGQQQTSPQSPYEPVQPYQQPRQSAAIEVLTNQFGVPPQYYETGPTSAPASAIGQPLPSPYNQLSYTNQGPASRDSIGSAYASGMADTNPTPQSAFGQSNYATGELDVAYTHYQAELKKTFESVRDRRLMEAGQSLVNITEWLLGNAEMLGKLHRSILCLNEQLKLTTGLVRDDEQMHADLIKLWEQFNTGWLAALQTQKEMTNEMLETGQQPRAPHSLMDTDQMEAMGKELVRLCDIMEKHGLVDYQMGVWEEEIISCVFNPRLSFFCGNANEYPVLNHCLGQLEETQPSRATSHQRRR